MNPVRHCRSVFGGSTWSELVIATETKSGACSVIATSNELSHSMNERGVRDCRRRTESLDRRSAMHGHRIRRINPDIVAEPKAGACSVIAAVKLKPERVRSSRPAMNCHSLDEPGASLPERVRRLDLVGAAVRHCRNVVGGSIRTSRPKPERLRKSRPAMS